MRTDGRETAKDSGPAGKDAARDDILSLSRRPLAKALPLMAFAGEAFASRTAKAIESEAINAGLVLLDQGTSPVGPCASAIAASAAVTPFLYRYEPHQERKDLIEVAAKTFGVDKTLITPWTGSSDALYRIIAAYTSAGKGLVVANPTFEVPERAAATVGSPVHRIPLRGDYSHDVRAMGAADKNAGVYYIVNPHNPTGTLTTKEDIQWLIDNKAPGSVVVVDEAHIEYTDADSCILWAAEGKDVIVTRTFSKIYGMAGMRCGLTFGRPDLVNKLVPLGFPGTTVMPINAVVAAKASLLDAAIMPTRKAEVTANRDAIFAFLRNRNVQFIPSVSNTFLLDGKQPGADFAAKMVKEGVLVGRSWPIWPNLVRISIGSAAEMRVFREAIMKIL